MSLRWRLYWGQIRSSYWFVPSLMAVFAFVLAVGAVRLDAWVDGELVDSIGWVYSGGHEGARGVLSVIAGSVITVAGTTFSITIASLSLASNQYGPRLLRSFMRDTGNQVVLGTFTSTFLYCLMVLRTVRGTDDTTFVPHLAVTIGVALALANVGVLIYFIHHTAESIQVSHIIEALGTELDQAVDRLFPEGIGENASRPSLPAGEGDRVKAPRTGYIRALDQEAILRVATGHNLVVRASRRPGDFVTSAVTIAEVWPKAERNVLDEVRGCFDIGPARTPDQDAEFAFQQLAEVAVRTLSPGINDPFTAMACVDRLAASLGLLHGRRLPASSRTDEKGEVRVVAKPYRMERLVRAAFRTVVDNSVTQPAVLDRIEVQLRSLAARTVRDDLRKALRVEIDRVAKLRVKSRIVR